MQSKSERFKQWRGSQFDAEQNALKSALLISDYVSSVESFELIRDQAELKFQEFEQFKARSFGTVVFAKLFIDEAISHLSENAVKEKKLLTQSSMILSEVYQNWKNNTKENVLTLIKNIEELFRLNTQPFTDKQHYQSFLLSSYMLFHIVMQGIMQVEKDWRARLLVSVFFDLGEIKIKILSFLQKTEEKIKGVAQLEKLSEADNDPLKPAKERLNQRYLKVLGITPSTTKKLLRSPDFYKIKPQAPGEGKPLIASKNQLPKQSIFDSLTVLEEDIEKASSGLVSLIMLQKLKNALDEKMEKVGKLIAAIDENDKKIIGRKNFLELLEDEKESFQFVLEETEKHQRKEFLEKIEQLKCSVESPTLSSGVIHGVSWVATPITAVYRTTTPQSVQEIIGSTLPASLESECKRNFKTFANQLFLDLQSKLDKKNRQINIINHRSFSQDEILLQLIKNERLEHLVLLKKANDSIKDAVQSCRNLLFTIKQNLLVLDTLQGNSQTLREFVHLHNGFLVKISNFLAQYFAYFKTQTAKMIDDAVVLQAKIGQLASEYQQAVNQRMRQIESTPHLDDSLKIYMKTQLILETQELIEEKRHYVKPSKRAVRLLINNLSSLWAEKTQPHDELAKQKEQEEEQTIFSM